MLKYTIEDFNQEKLIKLGLDLVDAMILRYFIDFMNTKKMKARVVEGECYYWLSYDAVIKEFPILNLNTRDSVYRRFKKLVEAGVLKHVTIRENGTYAFYTVGEKYEELLWQNLSDNNSHASDIEQQEADENLEAPGCKVGTNKPSTRSIYNKYIVEMNLDGVVKKAINSGHG